MHTSAMFKVWNSHMKDMYMIILKQVTYVNKYISDNIILTSLKTQ